MLNRLPLSLAMMKPRQQGRARINQYLGPLLSLGMNSNAFGEGNGMRVLAMASQKGGSGKTTLSGHLAVQAQLAGAGPVCLIDIDPQGSLADWWNERHD